MNLKNFIPIFTSLLTLVLLGGIQHARAQDAWNLEGCLAYSREHNRELEVRQKRSAMASTEVRGSKARLLPTVAASVSLDHYWQIPVQVFPGELAGQPQGTFIPVRLGTPWMGNASLQGEMPLIDASLWRKVKISMLEQQLKSQDAQSTRQLIAKNVRMSYYTAQLTAEQWHVAKARAKDFEESHKLVNLNFGKGLTDQIAVNQSATLLKDLVDDAGRIQASYLQALLDLKFWMGYPLSDPILLDTANFEMTLHGMSDQFSVEKLPDFAVDSLQVLAGMASLRQERASLYPKLTAVSGYSKLGFGSELGFITRSPWFSSGYVGLRLSLPLFDLRQMRYQIRGQKEKVELAMAQKQANAYEGTKLYMAAKLRYSRASRQLGTLDEKLVLADQNVGLAGKKLEKGIIDMMQLKQVQDELTVIRRERLAARLQMLVEMVEMEYLQGDQ